MESYGVWPLVVKLHWFGVVLELRGLSIAIKAMLEICMKSVVEVVMCGMKVIRHAGVYSRMIILDDQARQ